MTKKVYNKVMFVGRATTFMVGLAMILVLTVGLASTALAGTGVGAAGLCRRRCRNHHLEILSWRNLERRK